MSQLQIVMGASMVRLVCGIAMLVVVLATSDDLIAQVTVYRAEVAQTIPSEGDGYVLVRPVGIAVQASGDIWVADATELTILVFGADGRFKGSIGRRGQGPGEFQLLRGLGWVGDTVYVLDQANVRATLFREDGSVLREFRLPQATVGYEALAPFRLLSSSEVLASPQLGQEVFGGDGVIPLVRIPLEDGQPSVVTRVSVSGMAAVLAVDGRHVMVSGHELVRIARPSTPWTVSQDSRRILKIVRTANEPGSVHALIALSLSGDTVFRRYLPYVPTPIPSDVVDSLYRSMLPHLRGVPEGTAMNVVREVIPRPRWYPPFLRMVAGRDGSVFVERSSLPGPTIQWDIFDANGMRVGVVDIPRDVRVETVTTTVVWGVRSQEDGTQDLVQFRLVPTDVD